MRSVGRCGLIATSVRTVRSGSRVDFGLPAVKNLLNEPWRFVREIRRDQSTKRPIFGVVVKSDGDFGAVWDFLDTPFAFEPIEESSMEPAGGDVDLDSESTTIVPGSTGFGPAVPVGIDTPPDQRVLLSLDDVDADEVRCNLGIEIVIGDYVPDDGCGCSDATRELEISHGCAVRRRMLAAINDGRMIFMLASLPDEFPVTIPIKLCWPWRGDWSSTGWLAGLLIRETDGLVHRLRVPLPYARSSGY